MTQRWQPCLIPIWAYLLVFGPAVSGAAGAEAPDALSRAEIVKRVADLRRIATPEGIEELREVELGGASQWISIRGRNRNNPVLLMIHGGAGTPMMPSSWAFQTPWEDFFTVVQWDQRGVGKNYVSSDHDALAPSMTVERHVKDAEELVAYLRKQFNKKKVTVLGYSWGSAVGLRLAKRRAEWLHAYIGVGQTTDRRNEDYIYDRLLFLARQDGNEEALSELESIAPYPGAGGSPPLEATLLVRKWARAYNGGWYGRDDLDVFYSAGEWAPEYTQEDLDAAEAGAWWALSFLLPDLSRSRPEDLGTTFELPIIFLMGRYDLFTPYEPAYRFFSRIDAPLKKFVTFERSAHFPMFQEPGRFLMTLVEVVLPLTGEEVRFNQKVFFPDLEGPENRSGTGASSNELAGSRPIKADEARGQAAVPDLHSSSDSSISVKSGLQR